MKLYSSLIFLLLSTQAVAGPAVIWGPSAVKTLKPAIDINGAASILTGSADPTSVAQNAPAGSLYLRTSGGVYRKTDAGLSTNWTLNVSSSNTGDLTLAAVGSTPNANGASLSGQALTLQPADAANPGALTAVAQNIGGPKTFSGIVNTNGSSQTGGLNTKAVGSGVFDGVSITSSGGSSVLGLNIRDSGEAFLYDGSSTLLHFLGALGGTGPVSPSVRWDVNGADSNTTPATPGTSAVIAAHNIDSTVGNFSTYAFVNSAHTITSAIEGVNDSHAANGNGHLSLLTTSASTLTERARLTSTGLGIGNISPSVALDVNGSARVRGLTTAGFVKTDSSGNLTSVASAGGGAGLNLVGLDTSYVAANTDDRDAEFSVGNWLAFNNTAAVSPTTMTGGSPSITCLRTTTAGHVLDGSASFEIVKGASNRQGDGCSVLVNIPPGYTTTTLTMSAPFKVISGTLVQGDVKLYAYDVTNSRIITPFNNDVVGSQGMLTATFPVSTNTAQIRAGFYFSSTAATALTYVFDDFSISPQGPPLGLAGSSTAAYPLVIGATTTAPTIPTSGVTVNSATFTRVGDHAYIRYDLVTSGVSGSANGSGTYLFPLPTGLVIDTNKQAVSTAGSSIVGNGRVGGGATADTPASAVAYNSTSIALMTTSTTFFGSASNLAGSTNWMISLNAWVPIAGWDANVTMAQSSTFRISSFLTNGTRVTATPTRLGEYRSKIKAATSTSNDYFLTPSSWTDTAPTNPPTSSDGMNIYAGNYTNAGTSGQPNLYQIFIGKNKNYKMFEYDGTGFTLPGDATPFMYSGGQFSGVSQTYDPATGVLELIAASPSSATSGSTYLSNPNRATSGYVDVVVSENALAVGIQAPRSEIALSGFLGYGSTNTKVMRYQTAYVNTGTAILWSGDDSTNGQTFTILEDGIYTGTISIHTPTTDTNFGFSVDSSQLTTNIGSITDANILANGYEKATYPQQASFTRFLRAGQVVRAHGDGTSANNNAYARLSIAKVSN